MVVSLTAAVVGAVVLQRALSLLDVKRCRAALDLLRTGVSPAAAPAEPEPGKSPTEAGAMLPTMEPPSRLQPAFDGPAHVADRPVAELSREPFRADPVKRPRSSGIILATVAAVAGALALALGSWSFITLTREPDRPAKAERIDRLVEQAVALLANPATQRIPFDGSKGGLTFVVTSEGDALLIITGLKAVPAGKTYQAWVIDKTGKPQPAGVFSGRSRIVRLERRVPPGATVAVTLEREGGAAAPTQAPKLIARRT